MNNWTKGEWRTDYRKHKDGTYSQEVFDIYGETIAILAWHSVELSPGHITTDREANAYLISAAPDMYEALRAYQKFNRIHNDAESELFELGRKALVKAEAK